MTFNRLIPTLVCVAALSACASGPNGSPGKPPSLAAAMAEADAAEKAGQKDKAYIILKGASSAFPTDKTPWQRMAQLRFDAGSYGEAITDALEALERDPDDTVANSIVAVSGLRVTAKALADLTQKNNISGSVRSEAQDLAKLLRSALGEEVLVKPVRAAPKPRETARPASPPQQKTAKNDSDKSTDPFGSLK